MRAAGARGVTRVHGIRGAATVHVRGHTKPQAEQAAPKVRGGPRQGSAPGIIVDERWAHPARREGGQQPLDGRVLGERCP